MNLLRPSLFQSETQEGYKRQYVVVALANEMAAGSMAVSRTLKPNGEECRKMVGLLEEINRELTSVMQNSVQMVSGHGAIAAARSFSRSVGRKQRGGGHARLTCLPNTQTKTIL